MTILPIKGEVRIAAQGLEAPQVETLPWGGTTTATATRDGVASTPLTVTTDGPLTSAAIPATLTQDLGVVRVTWTDGSQTLTTSVDVRGARLPDAELVRSLGTGSRTAAAQHPAAIRARYLGDALLELERECRRCLIPRRVTVTKTVRHGCVRFGLPDVFSIVDSATPGFTGPIDLDPDAASHEVVAFGSTTFTVDHGEQFLAPDISRAIVLLAGARLVNGPADDRGFAVSGDGGMVRMLTAGVGGAKFSIPDVEAAYKRHRLLLVG